MLATRRHRANNRLRADTADVSPPATTAGTKRPRDEEGDTIRVAVVIDEAPPADGPESAAAANSESSDKIHVDGTTNDAEPANDTNEMQGVEMTSPQRRRGRKKATPPASNKKKTSKRPSGRRARPPKALPPSDSEDDNGEEFRNEKVMAESVVLQPEVRRSGRRREPPKDSYNETLAVEQSKPKPARAAAAAANGKGKGRMKASEKWEPEYLMTKKKSPYATMDVSSLFTQAVWDLLTEEEKDSLLPLLPEAALVYPTAPESAISDPTPARPQLRPDFWTDNAPLKEGIAAWQANIEAGRYEPAYIAQAAAASERRLAGEFDSYKDRAYEEFWGQKQRLASDSIAGESSKIRIQELIKHQALRVGDVFSLRRTFHGGIVINKDAELIATNPKTYALTFSFPPGDHEYANSQRENVVVTDVVNIGALGTKMLKEHSQCPSRIPNGNAFKEFRIIRKQEDIGTLFEVRQDFFNKYLKKGSGD